MSELYYDRPDFIERNGTWLLTVLGVVCSCFGAALAYALRSRCTKIACCCFKCERSVLSENAITARPVTANVANSDMCSSSQSVTGAGVV